MAYRILRMTLFFVATVLSHQLVGPAYANKLFDVVTSGDLHRVSQLLDSGADPNERSSYDGPLHVAARLGLSEIVVKLLDAGADVELSGFGGVHPLHSAALAHEKQTTSILLARGANVDALDNLGRTPLLTALSGGGSYFDTVQVLLNAQANPNLLDGAAQIYALDYAAMQGRPEVIELLVKFGADVNIKAPGTGQSVLHFAIAHCHAASDGNIGVVEALIRNGADVNAKDVNGNTPLNFADWYVPNSGMLHLMLVKAGAI